MKSKKITLPKATQREMLKFFAQAFETMAAKEKDKQPQAPNDKGNKK
jgi:hypothetical protein